MLKALADMKDKSVALNQKRTSVLLSTSSNGDRVEREHERDSTLATQTTPAVNSNKEKRTLSASSDEDEDSLQSERDSSSNVSSMRTSSLRSQDDPHQNSHQGITGGGRNPQTLAAQKSLPMAPFPIYENHAFTDDHQTNITNISDLMTNLGSEGKCL